MSRPKTKLYLDWVELTRWFEQNHREKFKRNAVVDWLKNDHVSDGCLLTANGEVLDPECSPDDYDLPDFESVRFFMQTLHDEFPEAVNQYGDVKIHFWW